MPLVQYVSMLAGVLLDLLHNALLRLLGHTAYILHRRHGWFSCTVWMSSCDTLHLINSFADVLLSTPLPTRLFVAFLAFTDAGRFQRSFHVRLCDYHRIRPPGGSPYGRPDRGSISEHVMSTFDLPFLPRQISRLPVPDCFGWIAAGSAANGQCIRSLLRTMRK